MVYAGGAKSRRMPARYRRMLARPARRAAGIKTPSRRRYARKSVRRTRSRSGVAGMLGLTKYVWDRMNEATRQVMLKQHADMMLAKLQARRAVAVLKGNPVDKIDASIANFTTDNANYQAAVNAVLNGTVS